MANLYIDDLLANPHAKVTLAGNFGEGGAGDTVHAFLKEPVQLMGSNEYSSPDENSFQQALSNGVNAAINIANSAFGKNIAQQQIKHLGQTIQSWTGSGKPTFTIPMQFLIVRQSDVAKVKNNLKKLFRTVYPSTRGSFRIVAPLGYAVNFLGATAVGGTLALEIGTWFRATGLIMNNVNFSPSIEVVGPEENFPISVEGSIELQPFRLLRASEFLAYFR